MEDFPLNPYAPPEAPLEIQAQDGEGLRPIPFEDVDALPPFWRRVGAMFKLLFSDPYAFYDRMGMTSGLGAPFRFVMLMLAPVMALFLFIFGAMGLVALLGSGAKGPSGTDPAWAFPAAIAAMVLVYPLMIAVSTLLWGLLNHGCLWIWRGTSKSRGVGQSIRATVYTYAFILIVSFIPLVGLFAVLGGAVMLGIGLARLHRTDLWRGVAAVFTPILLCCGAYVAFFVFAFAGQALFK